MGALCADDEFLPVSHPHKWKVRFPIAKLTYHKIVWKTVQLNISNNRKNQQSV